MVRDSDAPPVEATGDHFIVRMHNDEFGDYEMRSEVVIYVPVARLRGRPHATTWSKKAGTTAGAGGSRPMVRRPR